MSFIEAELNRCIGESTAARDLLARLGGTSFAVHVEGLGLTGVLHADGERVRLDSDATAATATLSATPFDLLRLLRADGVSGVKRTRAALSGDLDVAEFTRVADTLPSYARPRFVRLMKTLATTSTHKHQKVALKKEGADPSVVTDPLLFRSDAGYVPLTRALYDDVLAGRARL